MITQNRGRLLWVLAALVAGYALVNVVIFYTTDGFGVPWFTMSLIVYGLVIVAAVALAIAEPSDAKAIAAPPAAQGVTAPVAAPLAVAAPSKVKIVERTVFETKSGKLVRVEADENGLVTMDHILVTPHGSFPVERVEDRLERLPAVTGEVSGEDAEAYLAKLDVTRKPAEAPAPPPAPKPRAAPKKARTTKEIRETQPPAEATA